MCGIVGFIDFKKKTSFEVLEKMTHTLIHRGPDAFGVEDFNFDDFQIGLGHRRLSLIVLLGLIFRFYNVGYDNLWFDEFF